MLRFVTKLNILNTFCLEIFVEALFLSCTGALSRFVPPEHQAVFSSSSLEKMAVPDEKPVVSNIAVLSNTVQTTWRSRSMLPAAVLLAATLFGTILIASCPISLFWATDINEPHVTPIAENVTLLLARNAFNVTTSLEQERNICTSGKCAAESKHKPASEKESDGLQSGERDHSASAAAALALVGSAGAPIATTDGVVLSTSTAVAEMARPVRARLLSRLMRLSPLGKLWSATLRASE